MNREVLINSLEEFMTKPRRPQYTKEDMNLIAFDLEIADIPEPGAQISPVDRLGISVAAGVTNEGKVIIWHGADNGQPTPRMTAAEARQMMTDLAAYDQIVTWNGAAFDFHVLGIEAEDLDAARVLARGQKHVDLMMLFSAIRRHRLGLKAAAAGCQSHKGGGGITSGVDAPGRWANGEFENAIEYVTQDSQATMDVYQHLATHGGFDWVSARGSRMIFRLPPSLMNPHTWTVENLLSKAWSTPERWITNPVEKADFTAW